MTVRRTLFPTTIQFVLALTLAWLASAGRAEAQFTYYGVVPNSGAGTVGIYDVFTGGVVGSGPTVVNGNPNCTAGTRDGRFAWSTTRSAGTVVKIDVATGTVLATVLLSGLPVCLALTPDEQFAYVTDINNNTVHKVDLASAVEVGSPIPVGSFPHGIAITPDGSKLYTANLLDNTVSVVDTSLGSAVTTIPVGFTPIALGITRDGTTLYVSNNGSSTLTKVDLATNTPTATIPVSVGPGPMDFSPDGTVLYVAEDVSGNIDRVDLVTNAVTSIHVGGAMTGISFTADGTFAVALDSVNDAATIVQVSTFTPVGSFPVGANPATLVPFLMPSPVLVPSAFSQFIASDADLTALGVGPFINFHGGTVTLAGDFTTNRKLSFLLGGGQIDTAGHNLTVTGDTVGEGPLIKLGAGRLVLAGTTGHASGSWVLGGVLEVDGVHAQSINLVDSGASLAGTGTVGNVDVISGGISPGGATTTGILSAQSVLFEPGTSFNARLNGPTPGTSYDQLTSSSGITLDNATLNLTLGFTPTTGMSFTILRNVVSGTFNGLPEGAHLSVGGQVFRITYHGGCGNDVRLDLDQAPTLGTLNDVTQPGGTPQAPYTVMFLADDDMTLPVVSATSSNQTLVPNANLALSAICTTWKLIVTPAAQQAGQTTITVTASDGFQTTQRTFNFIVTDAAPTLLPVSNQTIAAGGILNPVALTVSDDLTLVPDVGITATSSNQSLLTNANIVIGAGASRTLSATPTPKASGTTTITVTATDNGGHSVQQSFLLTVTDAPPTIDGLGDQTISGGGTLGPIAFTVGDDVTDAAALVVTATSSNTALVPDADLVLGGSGATRTLTATPVLGASGSTTITVSAFDGTHTTTSTFILTVTALPVYYLAEGATSSFFDTDILIANPNNASAPITLTFYKDDGSTVVQAMTLLPTSRTTVHVKEIGGMAAAAFSTSVMSTGNLPLVVERTMSWDANGYGSSGEKASSGAASTWYFAEGSQGYFHTFFLLLNPHAAANVAHVTFFLEDGSSLQRDYPLAATSRTTLDIATEPALANRSFGAMIAFDLPGMAERAMYFGDSPAFSGGHDSAGVTTPATSWFLAEGATGTFFDTFLLLANPGDTTANVTTTYLPASGVPVATQHAIAPHQRLTVNIATEDASLASAAVATSVSSDRPVIVERSQYWPHGNWYEAHNSAGETTAGTRWGLAEGRVGGTSHAQTYLLLANPGTQDASVTATFLRSDGTTIVKTVVVPATSRVNVAIAGAGSDVPELVDESFGTVVESTQPIIVERSMYSDANGVTWAAGTNAAASRLP